MLFYFISSQVYVWLYWKLIYLQGTVYLLFRLGKEAQGTGELLTADADFGQFWEDCAIDVNFQSNWGKDLAKEGFEN